MLKLTLIAAVLALAGSCASLVADIDDLDAPPARYKALTIGVPARGTWAILDRDGANRKVDPYLSSLGQGEFATGTISSPSFALTVDQIRSRSAATTEPAEARRRTSSSSSTTGPARS